MMGEREQTIWASRFFLLMFLWSWGFWGVLVLTGAEWSTFPAVLLYTLGGFGPTAAAAILVLARRHEVPPSRFWRRAIDVRRIPPVWYLVILGIAVVPNALARLIPASGDPEGTEGEVMLVALLLVAVLAGVAEEPGWRGYALDRLTAVMPTLAASVLIGVAWTLWHLPFYVMTGTIQEEAGLWSADFWVEMTARIPLAVLFAWVVLNTGRSILAAILLHAADNVASVLIGPEGTAQLVLRLGIVVLFALLISLRWRGDLRVRTPAAA